MLHARSSSITDHQNRWLNLFDSSSDGDRRNPLDAVKASVQAGLFDYCCEIGQIQMAIDLHTPSELGCRNVPAMPLGWSVSQNAPCRHKMHVRTFLATGCKCYRIADELMIERKAVVGRWLRIHGDGDVS